MSATARKNFRPLAARLVLTFALVAFLAWRLDLQALGDRLTRLQPSWIALAVLAVVAAIGVSAWKWGLILARRGRPLPFGRLLRHYFVGLFFNNVLPTTVGGDAVRAWDASRDTGEYPEAVGSVVSERLIAGVALGVTSLFGLPFIDVSWRLSLLVALFLAIDFGMVGFFLAPKVAEGVVSKLLPPQFAGMRHAAGATVRVVRATLQDRALFATVVALSVLFQALVAAVNACIFEAMGVHVGLARCLVYTPMIFTVTMLPISLSGLGVREAAYWFFFAQAGVGQAECVGASLAFFVTVGLCSLPGAALFALSRRDAVAAAAWPEPSRNGVTS